MEVDDETTIADWIPEEILDEFIMDDFNEDTTFGIQLTPQQPHQKKSSVHVPLASTKALLGCLPSPVEFSSFGLETINVWMQEFSRTKCVNGIVGKIPHHCLNAAAFFKDIPQSQAADLLTDLVTLIVKPEKDAQDTISGEITCYEDEILEYIGGYTLHKAIKKFGFHESIDVMTGECHRGDLIEIMEKRVGALNCPSEDYLRYIEGLYSEFTKEVSKRPADVNFKELLQSILNSQQYEEFLTGVKNNCLLADERDLAPTIVHYLVQLCMKVLSHAFAKKLFAKIKSKAPGGRSSIGLRGQLQQQLQ